MKREVKLPLGTTLEEWRSEILRLYPTARFQHDGRLGKWHATIGLFRKGTWYDSPHTNSWVMKEVS